MDRIPYRSNKELSELVKKDAKELKSFFQKLKSKKTIEVDNTFHLLHEEAFNYFDCLECANCCSSISPIITEKDIDKLSKHLKIKPSIFVEKYLHIDEDKDFVFNDTPCPFLLPDNYCMVYENRPKACREYPHTDRRKMQQILKITLHNCEVCPVVYGIVDEMKRNHF